jgi:DNA polymerase-3 subunit gamma/tau
MMSDQRAHYRVLARKYRPQSFAELIGQEAMVRTLRNAIAAGRVAHAFILTGVRGVGKTTTARILARALNCVGPEGTGAPTAEPCGQCEHCRAIAEDRHVDVIEMDAASRTGVDDIRDLTEGVRYRPVSARYKVYIIDEVHMLSKNAFNALLKTLEEPPPDVVFIFATTEVHKVPVTVLSRCQRYALRRVPVALLAAHYAEIAEKEGVAAEGAALGLIARAADGSVRDGLSLLDQAIALSGGRVEEAAVRDMLGIVDRSQVFDLFESLVKGDAAGALARLDRLYEEGGDPLMVLQDLLDLVHFVTRLKLAPEAGIGDPIAEGDRERARPLATKLSIPVLARAWQMLLKGLAEVAAAPVPLSAAQMVLVRLAYVADLPAPADLVRAAERGAPRGGPAMRSAAAEGGPASALPASPPPDPNPAPVALAGAPMPQSFEEVLALFEEKREVVMRSQLAAYLHLVHFEPGRIEFRPAEGAPRDLANRLAHLLSEWTGRRWVVAVSREEGAPTRREEETHREGELKSEAAAHPLVRAVLETFPGARIAAIRERFSGSEADGEEAAAADPGDEATVEEDEA